MIRQMGSTVLGLTLCFLVIGQVGGQQPVDFSQRPGTWEFHTDYFNGGLFKATPAETKVLSAKIEELAAILRPTPVFNPPLGIQVRPYARYVPFICELRHNCLEGPLISELDVVFYAFLPNREGHPVCGNGAVGSNAKLGLVKC